MITTNCPQCGVSMQIPAQYAGRKGRCNSCNHVFTVPAATATAATPTATAVNPFAPAPMPTKTPKEAASANTNPFDPPANPVPMTATTTSADPIFNAAASVLEVPATAGNYSSLDSFFGHLGQQAPATVSTSVAVPETSAAPDPDLVAAFFSGAPAAATASKPTVTVSQPPGLTAAPAPATKQESGTAENPFATEAASPATKVPASKPAARSNVAAAAVTGSSPFDLPAAEATATPAPPSFDNPFAPTPTSPPAKPAAKPVPPKPAAPARAIPAAETNPFDLAPTPAPPPAPMPAPAPSKPAASPAAASSNNPFAAAPAPATHTAPGAVPPVIESPFGNPSFSVADSSVEEEPAADLFAPVAPEEEHGLVVQASEALAGTAGKLATLPGLERANLAVLEPISAPPVTPSIDLMKIKLEAVEPILLNIPTLGTLRQVEGVLTKEGEPAQRVFVKLIGSHGLVGWAEVAPTPGGCYERPKMLVTTLKKRLASVLRGQPAWDVDGIVRAVDEALAVDGRRPAVVAGVELAVYDLLARTLEIPIYAYLGGRRRKEIPLSYTITARNAEEAASQVQRGQQLGYSAYKVNLGFRAEKQERQLVEAVADSLQEDQYFWADGNLAFTFDSASRWAQWLARRQARALLDPLPIGNPAIYSRLTSMHLLPIATSRVIGRQADWCHYLATQATDLPFLHLQALGGYRAAGFVGRLAQQLHYSLGMISSGESALGVAHAAQLAMTLGVDGPVELIGHQFLDNTWFASDLKIQQGKLELGELPGCGLNLDEAKFHSAIVPG